MKIVKFKTYVKDFDKSLIAFFSLEGAKNLQIIEIQDNDLYFQAEFFKVNTNDLLLKFTKVFPDRFLEVFYEEDISYEEWKSLRLKSIEVGRFKFKPFFQVNNNDINNNVKEEVFYLDTIVGAFGIDNHPTTFLCLEILDSIIEGLESLRGFRVGVDFGAGNGILSLALSKFLPFVFAIEIIYSYCLEIKRNCLINGVSNVFVINGNNCNQIKGIDFLVSNVPLSVFRDEDVKILASDFRLGVLSGVRKENKEEFLKILERYSIKILDLRELDNWLAVLVSK